VHYVVRASILLPIFGPLSQRAIHVAVTIGRYTIVSCWRDIRVWSSSNSHYRSILLQRLGSLTINLLAIAQRYIVCQEDLVTLMCNSEKKKMKKVTLNQQIGGEGDCFPLSHILIHSDYDVNSNCYIHFFSLKPHFICNLYIYIQEIGVKIGRYSLGRGTPSETWEPQFSQPYRPSWPVTGIALLLF
jgi:hypothetical protein